MLGVDCFDMTDLRLRQAKNEPDLEFEGMGISLSGDLLLLKPIGKPSFAERYREPAAKLVEVWLPRKRRMGRRRKCLSTCAKIGHTHNVAMRRI